MSQLLNIQNLVTKFQTEGRGFTAVDGISFSINKGETLAIVGDEHFAPLFQPGSLAEVPVVAQLSDGEHAFEIEGQIDRLAILDGELMILDYKTNRPPPETPETVAPAYIVQLAAYRAALRELFPGRLIRAALLWTDGPRLMEIPSSLLDAAESRFP